MSFLSISIKLKFLFLGFLLVYLNSCEVNKPALNPDYTGQKGQVTDIEGNVYKTIGIGSQIWMAENLKTTTFNDNSPIPFIIFDSIWGHLPSPGYCWYNNDSTINKKFYGALYNFYVIETGIICPTGWHVPEESDWDTLQSFLGGYKIAGGKLKDYYTSFWSEPNPCFVNNYSFSGLPGGERLNITGRFIGIGESGNWWTSSSINNNHSSSRSMSHDSKELYHYLTNKKRGISIRCIKDKI
jgi:uncharacterized protein (TIGR02145 family)